MNSYVDRVNRAGIGHTPKLCQDALIEMLSELFDGKKYAGQEGRKPLHIIRQETDIPTDDDAMVDTDASVAPYIRVAMVGGEIPDDDSPQLVEFNLTICTYDTGTKHQGFQDVQNIKEDIIQRLCSMPYFGGAFTVLKPLAWAVQQELSLPYYFGAINFTCTAPAMTQDTALKELV